MRFPFLLYTYLIAEIVAPLLASLIILTSVIFLGRIVPLLDILFDYGIQFTDFIRICAYMAPQLLLFSMPMASMAGVILGFSKLAEGNELMAFKSCGTGLYRMVPPILLIALSTAALTGVFSIRLIPAGTIATEHLLFKLAKEKIDQGLKQNRFSEGLGGVVLYTDRIDPESGEWHGVYVSDKRDPKRPATIMAASGTMQANPTDMQVVVNLQNGSLHRRFQEDSQEISFKRYTLGLNLNRPATAGIHPGGKRSLTMQQLLSEAKKYGPTSANGLGLLIEYHQRLALAAGCLILTILGLPLGFLATPGRRSPGIPMGLVCFILYFVLSSAAKTIAESQIIGVGPAMWTPNLLFATLTLVLLRSTARESFYGVADRLTDRLHDGFSLVAGLIFRKKDGLDQMELHGDEQTGLYHRPGCLNDEPAVFDRIFSDAREARLAGFTPCELCKPLSGTTATVVCRNHTTKEKS